MSAKQKFFGKYRGVVRNNVDPMREGRLLCEVADVLGPGVTSWCIPCLPFSGIQQGMFVAPNIGSGVWIEFEKGDQDHPIWVGGFWGSAAEVPALAQLTPPGLQAFCMTTLAQNSLLLSDMPGPTGGFLLKTTTGAIISVSDAGILISNGKGATILMAGPSVTINAGALVVT
jgi:hypothetical protein